MSTRGTAFFEIQNESGDSNEKSIKVGRIGIAHDGYPSGFGKKICNLLDAVYVANSTESVKPPSAKVFNNVEGVILHLLYEIPSDYLFDDEYVYRFIFNPSIRKESVYRVEDIITVEVIHQYNRYNFSGTFAEFKAFCND